MDVVRIGEHHPSGAEEALQAAEERMLAERVQLRAEGAALPRAAAREKHMGWHAAAPLEVQLRGGVVHEFVALAWAGCHTRIATP